VWFDIKIFLNNSEEYETDYSRLLSWDKSSAVLKLI